MHHGPELPSTQMKLVDHEKSTVWGGCRKQEPSGVMGRRQAPGWGHCRTATLTESPKVPQASHVSNLMPGMPVPHAQTQLSSQGPSVPSSRKPSLCQDSGFFYSCAPTSTPAYIWRFGINYIYLRAPPISSGDSMPTQARHTEAILKEFVRERAFSFLFF